MDLTKLMQMSNLSRLQGPFPAPSWMKNIQQREFRAMALIQSIKYLATTK